MKTINKTYQTTLNFYKQSVISNLAYKFGKTSNHDIEIFWILRHNICIIFKLFD